MIEKNPDLVALHAMLGEIIDALVLKQEAATDPAVIKTIAIEIRETLFRVTSVQQALFKTQTEEITGAVAEVVAAQDKLTKAIAQIEKVNRFIKTITSFLSLVDNVIDTAKLV